MGDRDSRTAAHQVFERLLDFLLGGCVDRGGGFVQDQDARIDQQGARNRNALALSTRKGLAPFAYQRIVAMGWRRMNSWACAARAAATISSRSRRGLP